jgi:hypothetical protein
MNKKKSTLRELSEGWNGAVEHAVLNQRRAQELEREEYTKATGLNLRTHLQAGVWGSYALGSYSLLTPVWGTASATDENRGTADIRSSLYRI